MTDLIEQLAALFVALGGVIRSLVLIAKPVIPLLLWGTFWYFAVDWVRLRKELRRGGIVPLAVVTVAAVAVAIAVDPVESREFGPVPVSNFVHKCGWASAMVAVALLAGAAQVSRRATGVQRTFANETGIRGVYRED